MPYEIEKERKELFFESPRITRQAVDAMTGPGIKGKDDEGAGKNEESGTKKFC
jgi:hypothetical protein